MTAPHSPRRAPVTPPAHLTPSKEELEALDLWQRMKARHNAAVGTSRRMSNGNNDSIRRQAAACRFRPVQPARIVWPNFAAFKDWLATSGWGQCSPDGAPWVMSSLILPQPDPENPVLGPGTCCYVPRAVVNLRLTTNRYPNGGGDVVRGVWVRSSGMSDSYQVRVDGKLKQFRRYQDAFDALEASLQRAIAKAIGPDREAMRHICPRALEALEAWRLPRGAWYYESEATEAETDPVCDLL